MKNTITYNDVIVPIGSHKGKCIVIGSDHRGFDYKKKIIGILEKKGYQIMDLGTDSSERCDYPVISDSIGKEVSKEIYKRVGIGICGSGIGILIPASKHPKVLVARCLSSKEAETSRKHNNTNVLGIGADYVTLETALETIESWLKTPFYSEPRLEESYLKRYVQTIELEVMVQKMKT